MKIIKNEEIENIKRTYYIKGLTVVLYIYAKKNNIDADWEVCEAIARSFLWNVPYDKENIDDWVNEEIEVGFKEWNLLRDLDEKRILNNYKFRIERRKLNKMNLPNEQYDKLLNELEEKYKED